MSVLGDKLHTLLTHLSNKAEVDKTAVEDTVKGLADHLNETVVPAVEAKMKEVFASFDTVVKQAVSDALQFERQEAERITQELGAVYEKMVQEFGIEKANEGAAVAHATATAALAEEAVAPAETPATA
jgi:hypothetical protein